MREVGVLEAKTHFSALLDEVERGEELVITRHGKVVARLTGVGAKVRGPEIARSFRRLQDKIRAESGSSEDFDWKAAVDEGRGVTAFVIDASAVIAWIAPGQATEQAWRLLDLAQGSDFTAPYLFPAEVRNALLKLERQGRCLPRRADEGLELLETLAITIAPPPTAAQNVRLLAIARSERLSFYDVLYLDLAERTAATLTTRDAPLADVARRRGVTVWDLR